MGKLSRDDLRDRMWLWAHQEGSHNGRWRLPGDSRMTPLEAAMYMGIPNLIMVAFGNKPEPPFRQYALPLVPLKRVVWSVIGDSSSVRNDKETDVREVIALSDTLPNLVGGIMDDFLVDRGNGVREGRLDVRGLHSLREGLHGAPRPLDLWCVLYDHQLGWPVQELMEQVDVVTFWTWKAQDLRNLEENFQRLENLLPGKRKLLGCYMWDYGGSDGGDPIPSDLMRHQCGLGRRWLEEGRIEGMIFLASCICDLGIEAVEWTNNWLKAGCEE